MDIQVRIPGQKEFQSIKLTSNDEKQNTNADGINIAELYDNCAWQKTNSGYKLIFNANNFKSLVKKNYNNMFGDNHNEKDSIELKIKVFSWPNGKDKKLFTGSDIEYKLPAFKYDINGKIIGDGMPEPTMDRAGEFIFKLPSKVLATIHGLYKYSDTEKLMLNLGKNSMQAL